MHVGTRLSEDNGEFSGPSILRPHLFCRSGSFDQTTDPDQNYRTNKCDENGSYYPASRPNSQRSKEPTTDNSAHNAE